jgi:hypothetical protein
MTTITLDNFNTDTDQNNNRHISLIWKGSVHKVIASTFILDVTKGKSRLSFNITLRASGLPKIDDTDEFGVAFDIEYQSLAKLFGKTVDELKSLKVRFDPEAGTPIKAIDDELFVLSLTDPKFMNPTTNELNASQVLLSLLNYSFS